MMEKIEYKYYILKRRWVARLERSRYGLEPKEFYKNGKWEQDPELNLNLNDCIMDFGDSRWYEYDDATEEEAMKFIVGLGRDVSVTVDRPLGSHHPNYPDLIYPINYGYVNGTIAADGEEIDAYILGVDEPIKEFFGSVIAVIHRIDDVEDKIVVAPHGISFSKAQISEITSFQEKYFDIEILV